MPEENAYHALQREIEKLNQRIRLLEKKEFFLTKSQEIGKLGHFSYDPLSRVIEGSSELFRIFEVDPERPSVDAFSKAVHPEDRHLIVPFIDRSVTEGLPFDVEHRVTHRDGTECHVHAKGEMIETSRGRKVVGVVQDISARKRAEAGFARIFSMSLDMICIADINTATFIKVNPAFTETLGYLEAELLSNSFLNFIHPDDIESTQTMIENELQSGAKVINFENRYRCKDGSYRWLSWVSRPIPEQGITYAVARDITERKKAEEKIESQNRLMSTLLDNLQVGVFMVAAPSGKPLLANKQAKKLLGRGIMNGADKTNLAETYQAFKTGTDDFYPQHEMPIIQGLLGEAHSIDDMEVVHPDGNRIQLQVFGTPVRDAQGNVVASLVSFMDVTDRKAAEQERLLLQKQLMQSQRMQSIGRLAGGVAHDFNNMLSIITGNTEIALEDLEDDNPIVPNLLEINKAASRSTDLTRQLLAFARKQTISPKVLDMNETVAGMLKMLRRLIGEDIDLAWEPQDGLWPVRIDPSQIDQILANLCINSRDAIKGIGKVTIETGNMTISEDYCRVHEGFTPGEYVVLAVSDDGCGMGRETMNNLFEPFFTTKDVGQGTGLGLAMVYGIVKQNNGFINVYSELGSGTTFKLYFPKHAAGHFQVRTEPQSESVLNGTETILVVEDEEAILHLTKIILERLGYTVLSACCPMDALQISQSYPHPIDLLITDVVMPEMSGRELAQKLFQLYPQMKCLYMSGYTANVIAHHGVLDEGVQFINKPFSKQELATKVRETIEQIDNDLVK